MLFLVIRRILCHCLLDLLNLRLRHNIDGSASHHCRVLLHRSWLPDHIVILIKRATSTHTSEIITHLSKHSARVLTHK